ncbi:MAG: CehA/McbA family metallohydrolase, partial [Planctomycetes bacterium]|nr:CehA/McbA family metallohydrolase [Planctomycetota bacterium]
QWPKWPKGWGNRPGKAPFRYFGRFFYCTGEASVDVPAGSVRVEVWKGFEYRPKTLTTQAAAGKTQEIELTLTQTVPMPDLGYWSGDPHIHMPRKDDGDERVILDLLEAEDIHFSTVLAYNEPAGSYVGLMDKMASPQLRGLGQRSILTRGDYAIVSAQEYRSGTYGHINLFMLDRLVLEGQSLNANNWPPFGHVARDARESGGIAFYAHGGYAKEIYADVVQGNVDGVELLQFGVYRGIGLTDWYRMLNCGFRVPALGASDYPPCRKLGDCRTYVHMPPTADRPRPPKIDAWLRGMADGRSFFTTGPMLLLEVDGNRPGARIEKRGDGPHRVTVHLQVRSEVAPVTNVQLVINGRILKEVEVKAGEGEGRWLELREQVELAGSAWIAARTFSLSPLCTPDAEAHTNPVYVYVNGKAPFDRESLDGLLTRIDNQIAEHKKRKFAEQAKVLAYFDRSRDILLTIRAAGGAPAGGHPSCIAASPRTGAGIDGDPAEPSHDQTKEHANEK